MFVVYTAGIAIFILMRQINLDDWADGIALYLLKYMYNVRVYQQYKSDGKYKEALYIKRKCEKERYNLLDTINSIESYNLLLHGEKEEVSN